MATASSLLANTDPFALGPNQIGLFICPDSEERKWIHHLLNERGIKNTSLSMAMFDRIIRHQYYNCHECGASMDLDPNTPFDCACDGGPPGTEYQAWYCDSCGHKLCAVMVRGMSWNSDNDGQRVYIVYSNNVIAYGPWFKDYTAPNYVAHSDGLGNQPESLKVYHLPAPAPRTKKHKLPKIFGGLIDAGAVSFTWTPEPQRNRISMVSASDPDPNSDRIMNYLRSTGEIPRINRGNDVPRIVCDVETTPWRKVLRNKILAEQSPVISEEERAQQAATLDKLHSKDLTTPEEKIQAIDAVMAQAVDVIRMTIANGMDPDLIMKLMQLDRD